MKFNPNNVLTISFICLILISHHGYCSDPNDDNRKVKAGYILVENFYSCLTSDLQQVFCGKLFTNTPNEPKKELDLIWSFSNKNKQLFLRHSENIKDKDFYKRARKTVSYYNPRNLDRISDGYLYITVVHTLPDRFYSGIHKEIAFPIIKDETTGEYRIEFRNIKINGIIIDVDNEFVRDFNIIEALGFTSEPIKPQQSQNPEK